MKQGEIKYTAFIDILGFSNQVAKNITNTIEANKFHKEIEELVVNLNFLKNNIYAKESENFDELNDLKFNYLWISDTFVLSIEHIGNITRPDKHMQSMMIRLLSLYVSSIAYYFIENCELCIRGGVTSKFTYLEDRLLLGEGIIEAHVLEAKFAVNPRVIFATDIITKEILELLSQNRYPIVSKDCDGFYFVDFLNALKYFPEIIINVNDNYESEKEIEQFVKDGNKLFHASLNEMISKGLKDPQNMTKYMWLNEYQDKHNREEA